MGPSTPLQLSGSTKGTNQLYETRQELLYRSYNFLLYLRSREAPRIFFPTKGTSQLYDNHDRSLKNFSTNTWKIKKSFNHVLPQNIGSYINWLAKDNLPSRHTGISLVSEHVTPSAWHVPAMPPSSLQGFPHSQIPISIETKQNRQTYELVDNYSV